MKKSEIKNSADMFLYKAIVNLNSAKYLMKAFSEDKIEIDIEKIYFELQQSAEKILKSILTKNTIAFPKTHDIEQLLDICKQHQITIVEDSSMLEELVELSDYAVEGRYSIIHDDVNDSEKYCFIIEQIIKVVSHA